MYLASWTRMRPTRSPRLSLSMPSWRAVVFWEERLHPLSSLAISAEPPSGTWQAIEARIRTKTAKPVAKRFWTNLALWRLSTAGFAAAAAALALWIAVTPVPGPSLVAILHPPQQDQA